MKKGLKILLVIIAFIAVIGTSGFFYIKSRPVPNVEIGAVDLKNVKDGTYTGEYDSGMVSAAVTVKVEANRIVSIKIDRHDNGLGKKAEKITGDIINAQSPQVDVVSSATLSSRVICKAVQLALEKGTK